MNLTKRLLKTLALGALLSSPLITSANACSYETCPVNEQSFDVAIKRLKTLYPSINFQASWTDNSLQASARFKKIFLSGGFARKEGINLGGFITVACHEVGHALLSLSEGEADYFSSSDCMKKYFKLDKSQAVVDSYDHFFDDISLMCRSTFHSRKEIAQCIRIGISSKNAANLGRKRCLSRVEDYKAQMENSSQSTVSLSNFHLRCLRTDATLEKERLPRGELLNLIFDVSLTLKEELSFLADDKRVVERTYDSHNSPACRMQTLRHGNLLMSKPSCWFRN